MSEIRFDRLRLSVPTECITVTDESVFSTTISGDGVPLRAKYEQTAPFYYSITIDYTKKTTDLELSGKSLMEEYPDLISHSNITSCFENINQCGICHIASQQVVNVAHVKQCDVTCDVSTTYNINQLYNSISLTSSKSWCVRDITSNRFTIESTNTTKRFKSRMVVYDKEEEMSRKTNQCFLSTVTNPEEQTEYFKGKIRYELNLNSVNRIKHFFNVSDTRLSTLLNSHSDPIDKFLCAAIKEDNPLQNTIETSSTIRDIEHLLLLAICDYDLNKVELLIRDMYGVSRSVRRCKEPYVKLLTKLKENVPYPMNHRICSDISAHLKYMVNLMNDAKHSDLPNLRSMYNASRNKIPDSIPGNNDGYALLDIDWLRPPRI